MPSRTTARWLRRSRWASLRRASCSRSSRLQGSTTTTSRRRSRRKECRSSSTPSPSCSTASAPSTARWSLRNGIDPGELVERIWERDPTVWTGEDEASWLGWLDEPLRMRERAAELREAAAEYEHSRVVVLGMGGSSLAPLVLGQLFDVPLEVLDTTHPAAIR